MLKITPDTRRLTAAAEDDLLHASERVALWRQRLTRPERKRQDARRHTLKLLKGHYPDNWQAWRQIRRHRIAPDQQWRLVGGPLDGCVLSFSQRERQRHVCIRCPSQAMADVVCEARGLIEKMGAGPGLTVSVTIEVEHVHALYP